MLTATTQLNSVLDEETFADLAAIVATRIPSVSAAAWTGQQKFNGLPNEFTVDDMVAHYKAKAGGSLPSTNLPWDELKLNSTVDVVSLDHVVAYLVNEGLSIAIPVNSVAPVISGTGTGPFTVSNTGTWSNSPDSFTYQWQGDTVDLPGETANTLAADAGLAGVSVRCVVTAVNEAGSSVGANSNAIVGA